MFNNTFNNNKNKHELLNMFKRIIDNNDKCINFRICEIE